MTKAMIVSAFFVITLLGGVVSGLLDARNPFGPVNLAMMVFGNILLFMWFRIDAIERRYDRSKFLNVAVIGLPLVAFSYYLLRSRGLLKGLGAILVYVVAAIGAIVVGVAGAAIGYAALGRS
jgi:hypothetical protein